MSEERCEFSELYRSQCAHCRAKTTELSEEDIHFKLFTVAKWRGKCALCEDPLLPGMMIGMAVEACDPTLLIGWCCERCTNVTST